MADLVEALLTLVRELLERREKQKECISLSRYEIIFYTLLVLGHNFFKNSLLKFAFSTFYFGKLTFLFFCI